MKLDPKALEAFKDSLCEMDPPWGYKSAYNALQAYLDAADLVPRGAYDKARAFISATNDAAGAALSERDEARREAEDYKEQWGEQCRQRDAAVVHVANLGKQIAALRGVVDAARMLDKAIMSAHALPLDEEAGSVINALWIELRKHFKQLDAVSKPQAGEGEG